MRPCGLQCNVAIAAHRHSGLRPARPVLAFTFGGRPFEGHPLTGNVCMGVWYIYSHPQRSQLSHIANMLTHQALERAAQRINPAHYTIRIANQSQKEQHVRAMWTEWSRGRSFEVSNAMRLLSIYDPRPGSRVPS